MIIEIRPGEGGSDAKLFMADLGETYAKYLTQKG
jgi:protein subunit release factor A